MSKESVTQSDRDLTKGERTREKIVVKAMHWAACEGLGTLSIGKLARKMGISKSGLFLHFGSKENLETAVVKQAGDLFFQHVLQPPEEDRLKGIDRLWTLCDLWLKFVEGRVLPGNYFFNGALFHCAEQDGTIAQRIREIVWQWLKALRQAIEQGQWMGELVDSVDPKQTALELNGLLLNAQWCHVLEEEDGTQVRSAILAKLASMATEKIPARAFDSVEAWREYLGDRQT